MRRATAERDGVAVLRQMIVAGIVGVGQEWTFERLAADLGTDTATAGDLVREIARDGFIDLLADGFRVRESGGTEQDELVAVRLLLEPTAIRDAAAAARVADLITLREFVAEIGEAARANDFDRYHEAIEGLYATAMALVPNRVLADLVTDLHRRTRTEGVRQLVEAGLMTASEGRFQALVDMVERRDLDGVERAVAAGLAGLRFLGASLPGGAGVLSPVDDYPRNSLPFEVDDYADTGW